MDLAVDKGGHLSVECIAGQAAERRIVFLGKRLSDFEMDTALGLGDAGQDAVQVLAGLFDIGPGAAGDQFRGLESIAGLPFVGHGYWHYIQVGYVPCHTEHLDDPGVRGVVPVLCAAVSLGNPDGFTLFEDAVADVGGEFPGLFKELPRGSDRVGPLYAEHLVALAEINHELAFHKVGAKGDFRGVPLKVHQQVLEDGGVEDYVPVVGDKEIFPVFRESLQTIDCKLLYGLQDHRPDDIIAEAVLEIPDGLIGTQAGGNLFYGLVGEKVLADYGEDLVSGHPFHCGGDFVVPVWADSIKHAWLVYL